MTEKAPLFDLSTKSGQKKAAKHAAKEAKKVEKANADRDRDAYQQSAKEEAEAKKQELHANGGSDSTAPAHAEMGRRWLKQTLEKVGRTETDLAKELWERNLTAVTEVCPFSSIDRRPQAQLGSILRSCAMTISKSMYCRPRNISPDYIFTVST